MMAILTFSFSCDDGGQFGHGHLKTAVAGDHPYFCIGPGEFRPDRCRQREAHRSQAPGGDQGARFFVVVVLRLPHLVLAHVGNDDGVPLGLSPQSVDHVRGVKMAVVGKVLNVADR